MKFNYRKTPRAQWHGYMGANYFVTICTKGNEPYFGIVKNEFVYLTEIGEFLQKQIEDTINIRRGEISIACYAIMPNHIHLIVCFHNENVLEQNYDEVTSFGPQRKNLASVIRGIKSSVKKFANDNNIHFEWQGRYNDRIIRDHNEMNLISEYIENNPIKWDLKNNL